MTESSGTDLRSLLSQVASGQVAPEEASQRLGESDSLIPPPEAATPLPTPPSAGSEGPIQRVVVRATAVKLVLIGDPTVTGASVEGPHVARRDGGALVVDTDAFPGSGDFSYESDARRTSKRFGRWRGGETVIIKIRPELPVEVTVQAGSIVATRLEGGLRFVVEAGSLKATDCSGPIDGRVEAGSAKLDWLLDRGQSTVTCELGSVRIRLDRRSNVTVGGRAQLGSVDLVGPTGSSSTLVVGAGTATLDINVELGSAKVQVAS